MLNQDYNSIGMHLSLDFCNDRMVDEQTKPTDSKITSWKNRRL